MYVWRASWLAIRSVEAFDNWCGVTLLKRIKFSLETIYLYSDFVQGPGFLITFLKSFLNVLFASLLMLSPPMSDGCLLCQRPSSWELELGDHGRQFAR
jgi:hypothetical protein